MDSYAELWAILEKDAEGAKRPGLFRRRVEPDAAADIFLAFDSRQKKKILLISVSGDCSGLRADVPACMGLHITLGPVQGEGKDRSSLAVNLEDRRFADVFSVLSHDLVSHVRSKDDGSKTIVAALDRLRRWQLFLKQQSPGGLGPEEQRGLLGELWLLKEVLIKQLTPRRAVMAWAGPEGRPQDFIAGSTAVEVKTSVAKRHNTLRIANERQLDESGYDNLFLGHLALDEVDRSGITLAGLIESLREAVNDDPTALAELEDRLFASGFLEIHKEIYERTHYRVRSLDIYAVRDDFPRLTEPRLPGGVGDVRYSIVISDCSRFQIARKILEDALRRSVDGD